MQEWNVILLFDTEEEARTLHDGLEKRLRIFSETMHVYIGEIEHGPEEDSPYWAFKISHVPDVPVKTDDIVFDIIRVGMVPFENLGRVAWIGELVNKK